MSNLLIKIFDKKDYVRFIPIPHTPESGEERLNEFTKELNLNKGRVKSIQIVNHQETAFEYYEEYVGARGGGLTEYEDRHEPYTKYSNLFMVHYRCWKELKPESKRSP